MGYLIQNLDTKDYMVIFGADWTTAITINNIDVFNYRFVCAFKA